MALVVVVVVVMVGGGGGGSENESVPCHDSKVYHFEERSDAV
jgi:hypothetical protein